MYVTVKLPKLILVGEIFQRKQPATKMTCNQIFLLHFGQDNLLLNLALLPDKKLACFVLTEKNWLFNQGKYCHQAVMEPRLLSSTSNRST